MDPRLSHALVAVFAVVLTVTFYEVSEALEETARAVSSDVSESTIPTAEDIARRDERERKRERERVREERRAIEARVASETKGGSGTASREGRSAAGDVEADADPRRMTTRDRLEQRADELGVSVAELRSRRAERRGLSPEDYEERLDAREQWREDNGLTDPDERREFRRDRQAARESFEVEDAKALRETRRMIFEADPSLRDAAQAVRQLQEIGEQFGPADDAGYDDE